MPTVVLEVDFVARSVWIIRIQPGYMFCLTDAGQDILEVEMCLDDNHEIETASVLGDTEQMFEYKARDPACLKTDILAEAMEGRVEPAVFKEIKKLGKFYLETAFDYDLYR